MWLKRKRGASKRALRYYSEYSDTSQTETAYFETTGGQGDWNTMTGVMTTATTISPCVCDNDHHHLGEEERRTLTAHVTSQGEGTSRPK